MPSAHSLSDVLYTSIACPRCEIEAAGVSPEFGAIDRAGGVAAQD